MTGHLPALALGEHSIRQIDGLFSLNDLHAASGSNPGQRPGNFLNTDNTRALVEEIENAGISAISTARGRNGGTYACRELVIAYAAWISPAFHLKVIRVFLAANAPAQPSLLTAPDPATVSAPFDPDRIKAASKAASQVAADLYGQIFNSILDGDDGWKYGRWILAFAHDPQAGAVPYVRRMNDDAMVVSLADLPRRLMEPGGLLPTNKELAAIAAACNQKLIQRIEGAAA
ncbi:MAG: KilA-N domain-containing protein [Burkholderiaceae bacterium]|jgi:hypothetical protein|nr:KilA-N domain-containing protein [Burkholderiaceae bacterium]